MALQTSISINGAEGGSAYITAGSATGNINRNVTIGVTAEAGWEFVEFDIIRRPVSLQEVAVGGFSTSATSLCSEYLGTELSRVLFTDGISYYTDANGVTPAPFGLYGAGSGQYFSLGAGGLSGPFACFTTQPPSTNPPASISNGYCNCGNGCVDGYAPNRPCPAGCVPCVPIERTPSPIATTPSPTPSPVATRSGACQGDAECGPGRYCDFSNPTYPTDDLTNPYGVCRNNTTTTTPSPINNITPSPIFTVTPSPVTPPPSNQFEIDDTNPTPSPTGGGGGGGGGGFESDTFF